MFKSEYPCAYLDEFDAQHPEKYIERKIHLIEKDFKMFMTPKEKEHLKSLKTVISIDNAVRKIMQDRWDKEDGY